MCGITGFVLRQGAADAGVVRAMCDRIRHRGPDDEGSYVEGGCALGMRRLSIIDLGTGHQPMSNEDGSVWVVFNGEIYDYRALRSDLAARGHQLRTSSDTEVLVHLYEEYGAEGISQLRGMFAFAIWDVRRHRLLLARDRFGKKPLYYAVLPQGLYFASELKCLRAAGLPLQPDEAAIRLYFQFGYIPDPFTGFRGVQKLRPGCWLAYDAAGTVEHGRYWKPAVPRAEPDPTMTREQSAARLREVFDEAVRIRMIADVPLGAFLSGGIDSSCVVASMALQSTEPVQTFSIGFEESRFNELSAAALVARKYRTSHHEILVRPNAIELVQKLVRHFDEPFGDSSAIPTFVVSQFAVQHVKVALSGDGGDEMFGGYDRFVAIRSRQMRLLERVPRSARRLVSWVADRLPYSTYGKNFLRMVSRQDSFERYLERTFSPYYMRKELLRPEWMLPADAGFLTRTFPDCLLPEDADPLSRAMYFETCVNLPGDMLVKVDRMSMANSLEVRCPLLDQEVAGLAAGIPHAWRIHDGKGKRFLVEVFQDRLPPELLTLPKHGFSVPLAAWFRTSLRAFLWDHLTSARFLNRGFVSPAFLHHLLDEHDRGRRSNHAWLWWLLMLELWFREQESCSGT